MDGKADRNNENPRAPFRRLRSIFRRSIEREVDAELQFHLEERTAELQEGGLAAEVARERAERELGMTGGVRRELIAIDKAAATRRRWSERFSQWFYDIAYVGRTLRRSPGLVALTACMLGLGIGVNVAVFSLLDHLYYEAPPGVAHPEEVWRVQTLRSANPAHARPRAVVNAAYDYGEIEEIAAAVPPGVQVAEYYNALSALALDEQNDVDLKVGEVAGPYFSLLGVHAVAGRLPTAAELAIDAVPEVAVVSPRFARRYLGSAATPVGRTIRISAHPFTIIGVVDSTFHGADPDAVDVWVPMSEERWRIQSATWFHSARESGGRNSFITMLARAPVAARATLAAAVTLAVRHSTITHDTLAQGQVVPIRRSEYVESGSNPMLTLTLRLGGLALIILLIACANVANLLLARGTRRRHEVAVRLALGIGRARLVRLLLAESIAIALLGAAVATAAAYWAAAALRAALFPFVHWVDSPINLRVLAFAIALAVLVGVLSGLLPAWHASRPDLTASLKASARDGGARSRARDLLLIAQVALSVTLLAAAGLLARSLHGVETAPVGYDAPQLVFGRIAPRRGHEGSPNGATRLVALAERVRALPGVEAVALTEDIPLEGWRFAAVRLPGHDSIRANDPGAPTVAFVSAEFFTAGGLHLLQGRLLTAADHPQTGSAVVVNATMARTLWPGANPVGQCLLYHDFQERCTPVVGVVSDVHSMHIIEAQPEMHAYLPVATDTTEDAAAVVMVRAKPGMVAAVTASLRSTMQAAANSDERAVVTRMSDAFEYELQPFRIGAALFSVASALALLVAAIGVFGNISYLFAQRTRELGIRRALGASGRMTATLVFGNALRVVGTGCVIGLGLSLLTTRVLSSLLYQVSARDPVTLLGAVILLLAIAMLACVVPAWRATRIDPIIALRAE